MGPSKNKFLFLLCGEFRQWCRNRYLAPILSFYVRLMALRSKIVLTVCPSTTSYVTKSLWSHPYGIMPPEQSWKGFPLVHGFLLGAENQLSYPHVSFSCHLSPPFYPFVSWSVNCLTCHCTHTWSIYQQYCSKSHNKIFDFNCFYSLKVIHLIHKKGISNSFKIFQQSSYSFTSAS